MRVPKRQTASTRRSATKIWTNALAAHLCGAVIAHADDSAFLDEITVSERRAERLAPRSAVWSVDAASLGSARAASLDDVVRLAPSANVVLNSRGETLAVFRGGGERETEAFFDGAPINVPWDNRLNLAAVPSDIGATFRTTPAAVSALLGPNAGGGVIDIAPPAPTRAPHATARVLAGPAGRRETSGSISGTARDIGVAAAGGVFQRDAAPLSGEADLAFAQAETSERTNSDLERVNALLRVASAPDRAAHAAATLLYYDAAFGAPPNGRLDPAESNVRFWRYPEQRQVIGILSGGGAIREGARVDAVGWTQAHTQTIESFRSADFVVLDDRQQDNDRTYGARVTFEAVGRVSAARGVVGVIDARHRQRDEAFEEGAVVEAQEDFFRRRTISVGAELERRLGDMSIVVGGGGDIVQSLASGGRHPSDDDDDFANWHAVARAAAPLSARWSLSAAATRRARPPTQRELFGTAIDQFLLNPDLKAEQNVRAETTLAYTGARLSARATGFARFSADAIDQRNVVVDDVVFRQRVNLRGSRAFGIELEGEVAATPRLTLVGALTALRARTRDPGPDGQRFIAERPAAIARLSAAYSHPSGWRLAAEAAHRGRAYSLLPSDVFTPLPRSTSVSLEAAQRLRAGDAQIELFARADNVGDTLIEPQFGFPDPGRTIVGGIRISGP